VGWLLVLFAAVGIAAADDDPVTRTGHLNVATIDGSINPASSDYLQKAIAESETDGAAALLLELDTPGGLVASTKDIIQAMLNARVPIIVYVAPQGAWAGSAGTFITIAGNVAAMAPGTSIGAAHPVGIGGGSPPDDEEGKSTDKGAQKAENLLAAFIESIAEQRKRNVEWAAKAVRESVAVTADKALELGVIDIVAATRGDLLTQLREHPFPFQGEMVVLDLVDARQRSIEMDWLTQVLNVIVDPNVAVDGGPAGPLHRVQSAGHGGSRRGGRRLPASRADSDADPAVLVDWPVADRRWHCPLHYGDLRHLVWCALCGGRDLLPDRRLDGIRPSGPE
jgi:membrane-bound serine protease (ClpP class)